LAYAEPTLSSLAFPVETDNLDSLAGKAIVTGRSRAN
jgi:hypothetical protein